MKWHPTQRFTYLCCWQFCHKWHTLVAQRIVLVVLCCLCYNHNSDFFHVICHAIKVTPSSLSKIEVYCMVLCTFSVLRNVMYNVVPVQYCRVTTYSYETVIGKSVCFSGHAWLGVGTGTANQSPAGTAMGNCLPGRRLPVTGSSSKLVTGFG